MGVKFLVATHEKIQLARQLKNSKAQTSGVVKKRPRVEDNVFSLEDQQKIVAKIKKKYKQKCQDCEILKTSNADLQKRYKTKIEGLDKQLLVKYARLEEESTQRPAIETLLKGRNIQLAQAIEEISSLKSQMGGQGFTSYPMSDVKILYFLCFQKVIIRNVDEIPHFLL